MTLTFSTLPGGGVPQWFQYLQGTALITLPLVAAYIAYRQWRTAHSKVRLDLFEKRWEVYRVVQNFCSNILDNKPFPEGVSSLDTALSRAGFLFDREIIVLLGNVFERAVEIESLKKQLDLPPLIESLDSKKERRQKMVGELDDIRKRLAKDFEPYLTFKNLR